MNAVHVFIFSYLSCPLKSPNISEWLKMIMYKTFVVMILINNFHFHSDTHDHSSFICVAHLSRGIMMSAPFLQWVHGNILSDYVNNSKMVY